MAIFALVGDTMLNKEHVPMLILLSPAVRLLLELNPKAILHFPVTFA